MTEDCDSTKIYDYNVRTEIFRELAAVRELASVGTGERIGTATSPESVGDGERVGIATGAGVERWAQLQWEFASSR